MARQRLNPISDPISADDAARKLSRFDLAKFHMFNPNGIRAHWSDLGDRILKAADEGRCKNGAWVAYGPIGYYDQQLFALACRRKQFKVIELTSLLSCIRQTIERGEEFLASLD